MRFVVTVALLAVASLELVSPLGAEEFHANPDYALRYGWSEMQRDLTEIKATAAEMRRAAGHK